MTLRKVEVFTAGCSLCDEAVQLVQSLACPSCTVEVLDMNDDAVQVKAKEYGVARVPPVVVDGILADCCQGRPVDADSLRALGVGRPA